MKENQLRQVKERGTALESSPNQNIATIARLKGNSCQDHIRLENIMIRDIYFRYELEVSQRWIKILEKRRQSVKKLYFSEE